MLWKSKWDFTGNDICIQTHLPTCNGKKYDCDWIFCNSFQFHFKSLSFDIRVFVYHFWMQTVYVEKMLHKNFHMENFSCCSISKDIAAVLPTVTWWIASSISSKNNLLLTIRWLMHCCIPLPNIFYSRGDVQALSHIKCFFCNAFQSFGL